MTHATVAAASRKAKERNPEKYCAHPKCLWRGPGCPKLGHWRHNEAREKLGISVEDESR